MANPHPNTTGLEPGQHIRKPGPGLSVRLSAYLEPQQQQRLEAHLSGMTAFKRSKEVARLLMAALDLA
jgi:hypothetical protein